MTDYTALDNLPDVDIRLKALPAGDPRQSAMILGEAECRFCSVALSSPDPRTLVRWADQHESSQSHILCKQDIQQRTEVAPPEVLVSQGPPGDKFGGYDGHSIDQILGSDGLDLPYPPTHPKGQHGLDQVQSRREALDKQRPL